MKQGGYTFSQAVNEPYVYQLFGVLPIPYYRSGHV